MKPFMLVSIFALPLIVTAELLDYSSYTQPFLHAGLYPPEVNASNSVVQSLFQQTPDHVIAYGSARPAAVATRTNNATLAGDEKDRFNETIKFSPPMYDLRFNISNISLGDAASKADASSETEFLINGIIEVILLDSEVKRLADERKTLEYRLINVGREISVSSQADDGSCNMIFNTTCRDLLTTGILYSASRNNTGATPDAFREQCGDITINNYGFMVVAQAVSSTFAAPIFTSQNIAPTTPLLGSSGFLESNWDETAIMQQNNANVNLDSTSNEFNSYVRFVNTYNGTSSRASLGNLNFGNSTQQYYDALALFRALVVLERYIDPQDALNGTEYASVSCLRPSILTDRATPLPDLYWQDNFNATTGNIIDTSRASGLTVGAAGRWGAAMSVVIAMAIAVL